jgi:hypothetical protein
VRCAWFYTSTCTASNGNTTYLGHDYIILNLNILLLSSLLEMWGILMLPFYDFHVHGHNNGNDFG